MWCGDSGFVANWLRTVLVGSAGGVVVAVNLHIQVTVNMKTFIELQYVVNHPFPRLKQGKGQLTPSIACLTRSSLMTPLRCKLLTKSSLVAPELRQAIFVRPPPRLLPRKKLRRSTGNVTVRTVTRMNVKMRVLGAVLVVINSECSRY